MSSTEELTGPIWPIEPENEILFKQIYAYFLKSWGYKVNKPLSEIHDSSAFVASKAGKVGAIAKVPTISEETKSAYARSRAKLEVLKNSKGEGLSPELEKYAEKKVDVPHDEIHKHLTHYKDTDLQQVFLREHRNNYPDHIVRRFVVARKWKLDDSVDMLAKKFHWKATNHPTADYLDDGDAAVFFEGKHKEFIRAFKLEKIYLRGHDKENRPIVVIRVQKHLRSDCPDKDFERFICLVIEWVMIYTKAQQEGVDKGCILFDMTGFSLKNADLAAVKFLASAFESNYPECLGAIWIHNAPWIFNTVWKIIKGWLDPVVALKIHFTKGAGELEKFVDRKYIPRSLGGEDDYVLEYIEPTAESKTLPKDDKFDSLVAERDLLELEFLQTTIDWIESKTPQESYELSQLRLKIQNGMAKNYIQIDPYVRTKGIFERNGQVGKLGY